MRSQIHTFTYAQEELMIKVKLPKADWDWVLLMLEDKPGHVSTPIAREIETQVYEQWS